MERGLNKNSELELGRQFRIYQTCGNDRVGACILISRFSTSLKTHVLFEAVSWKETLSLQANVLTSSDSISLVQLLLCRNFV